MTTVILVIHILIALAMVGSVLLQRSEGGGLGMGGGMGGFMTGRSTANLLTRTTGVLAACFIGTSLLLAILADHGRDRKSLLDRQPPAAADPAKPAEPAAPAAPVAK
ncbi:MAG: preprotein translocase subunit SecG [Rhodospirillales bacterium]|nr:preprotein translocase subunit SecG [Rhodospirillales bacterium]